MNITRTDIKLLNEAYDSHEQSSYKLQDEDGNWNDELRDVDGDEAAMAASYNDLINSIKNAKVDKNLRDVDGDESATAAAYLSLLKYIKREHIDRFQDLL